MSLLLTAHLTPGAKAQLFPLASGRPPKHIPSLKNARAAHTIRMREVLPEPSPTLTDPRSKAHSSAQAQSAATAKRRDWLTLLVRETLGMSRPFPQALLPRSLLPREITR